MGERRATLILLLFLSLILFSLPQIGVVKAESIIYIRADGIVEGTDKIQRDGDVYTLTGDISGGIKVERNFTVIDGAGYILQGNGEENGIDIATSNVTVKNMRIVNFARGIFSQQHYYWKLHRRLWCWYRDNRWLKQHHQE
jgi:nitrous oxidase accessory protein NosD